MPRYHSSSSSSGSSYDSAHSYGSHRTYRTDDTVYSRPTVNSGIKSKLACIEQYTEEPLDYSEELARRSSVDTYASTIDLGEDEDSEPSGPHPPNRSGCYAPDAVPATSKDFASLFPSTKRLLIQHDDSCVDGNMNLRVDTEITTNSKRVKKVTLFHLRMKDLQEREFSLRRYCRDSGREVASCKKKYVKSTSSSPKSRPHSPKSFTRALHNLSLKSPTHRRQDSGYESADDNDDDERKMQETLKVLTAPSEQVVARPTNTMRLEFSNYAQVSLERIKTSNSKGYEFEYWGDMYLWKREKHVDDGELVVSYHLINGSTNQKVAVIMPDQLSPQEAQWETKQGGWVPASSMRILRSDITDDLGDVIIATGLVALIDGSLREHFPEIDRKI